MADGKTHEVYLRIFWKSVIAIAGFSFILTRDFYFPLFILLNFAFTEVVSPDLDHFVQNKDESDAKTMSRNMSLALLLPKDKFKKNHKLRRFLEKINLGLFGALFSGWSEVYEYFGWLAGGHRSWWSHYPVIGTLTLMVWFNLPLFCALSLLDVSVIIFWSDPTWQGLGWQYFWMEDWLWIYLWAQFFVWNFTNGVHLILDTEWAKGRLYGFKKYKDLRSALLKRITNKILMGN